MTATFAHLDTRAFADELDAIRARAERDLGPRDLAHLRQVERWGRTLSLAGYATAWIAPNPISPLLLGIANASRWTIVAHHVLHKGYDKVPGVPTRLTSSGFAAGNRRFIDWLDWLLPEAWKLEHNMLHHFHTGETADPDLVEENASLVRNAHWPLAAKLGVVGFYALTWKFTYYAPNTFQTMRRSKRRKSHAAPNAGGSDTYLAAWDFRTEEGRAFWRQCVLPYGLTRFVAIPLCFAPLGTLAVFNVWLNTLGAELVANLHSFLVIAPNHAGEDLYRFEGAPRNRGEFYLRQVLGSANYETGHSVRDFLYGNLNYQIEHHLFPDLPASAYARIQPEVKAVCERHGVPYVQESLGSRIVKLVDIMIGRKSMRRAQPPHARPQAQPAA
jgi:fatty acid desaturase